MTIVNPAAPSSGTHITPQRLQTGAHRNENRIWTGRGKDAEVFAVVSALVRSGASPSRRALRSPMIA